MSFPQRRQNLFFPASYLEVLPLNDKLPVFLRDTYPLSETGNSFNIDGQSNLQNYTWTLSLRCKTWENIHYFFRRREMEGDWGLECA